MGNLISQVADGIGDALGSAFSSPFKSVFGASCEGVCSGAWDVVCFIEHLCVANLVKFVLIVSLCYILLLFLFLLFKLGICQCIGKSLCKMCWIGCQTYWYALGDISCFCWRKLTSTKRVYRGRQGRRRCYEDLEVGYRSSTNEETNFPSNYDHLSASKKRKLLRQSEGVQGPALPSSRHRRHSRRHHQVKLRQRQVSFRVGGSSRRIRSSRLHQRSRTRHHHRKEGRSLKRQTQMISAFRRYKRRGLIRSNHQEDHVKLRFC